MGEQLLTLRGQVVKIDARDEAPRIYSLSTNPNLPTVLRANKAYLVRDMGVPEGFAHYILLESAAELLSAVPKGAEYAILPDEFGYLENNDIIRVSPRQGSVRAIFRASSKHNSFLVTEQCNHYCLMCSQPPKRVDDSWILDEIAQAIPLIPRDTEEIGFTGGEPTLAGERFLSLLRLAKRMLPNTAVHILSNGRSFKNADYARSYADIRHHDMMVGIPLYSDVPSLHDYIVQSSGAFDETLQGILNLKELNQKVEIRVVLHKQSIGRLTHLCEFLARNLLFVDHVALMGLEMTGFTKANLDSLWIDPFDYKDELSKAVDILATAGMTASVYNHQLCVVNDDTRAYCRQSISDWKNEYANECVGCQIKTDCGGFFSSALQVRYSSHIAPIVARWPSLDNRWVS